MKLRLMRKVYLIIGVFTMLNIFGCAGAKFEKYVSKDKQINLSMDYLSGWRYDETRGAYDAYAQVTFFQFKPGQKSSRAVMEATVQDSAKAGLADPTLKAAVQDLLLKRKAFKDSKVLAKSNVRLFSTEAVLVELEYLASENLLNVNAKLIPMKEEVVVCKAGNNLYFLRYKNTKSEFAKFCSAFRRMVKSAALNP